MGTIAAVGTAKGLFLIDEDGKRGPQFVGEQVYAVGFTADGGLICASESQHWGPTIRFSADLGETWTEPDERVIAFPEWAGTWTDHWTTTTHPAALTRVWQVVDDGFGTIYAGVEPAALFKSTDGGRSFELVEGLWEHPHRKIWFAGGGGLALHTILVDPTDRDRLHVAISTGGVYRTDDGGKSWEAANMGVPGSFLPFPTPEFGQCVHKVARDAADPDVLYLQNHGTVYRSEDRGTSWDEIGVANGLPGDFGFPIVAHPRRGDTAYCIPLATEGRLTPDGHCRVYRTIDRGASWHPLSDGLPQDGAHFTVLRDGFCADDADPTGLWFGTKSGQVFTSTDDGDHWRLAAEYLPSVMCVRARAV